MTRLTYPMARILGSIAEKEALSLDVPMAIAIGNREGSLLFFGRMDGTLPASAEISVSKAYTAAALRMATHEVGRLSQPGGALYGIQHIHDGKIVLFGGGVPLQLKGRVAGSVGISGGTVEEDMKVARSVVVALEAMEKWSVGIRPLLPSEPLDDRSIIRLEEKLGEVFQQTGFPLPKEAFPILIGAILLASGER